MILSLKIKGYKTAKTWLKHFETYLKDYIVYTEIYEYRFSESSTYINPVCLIISTISITERIMLMDSLKTCYVEKMLLLLL